MSVLETPARQFGFESEYNERTDHTKIDPTHRPGSIDGRFGGRVARNV